MASGLNKSNLVRRRLIRAAERIFAEKGFRAMTVREVTREARVNVAAVNYHFGSKRDLMRSVVEERFGPVNRLRMTMLGDAAAECAPGPIPVERIIAIMIEPLFAMARKPADASGDVIMRMMGRCFAEPADFIREMNEEFFSEIRERFVAELMRSLPDQPPQQVRGGFFFAVATMIGVISDGGEFRFDSLRTDLPQNDAVVMDGLIRFISGGLLR